MHKIQFFIYIIILFIFSISFGNEKEKNNDISPHKIKHDLFFLKDVLKYKSDIQEYDIKEGKSYLKGKASIEYDNTKIEADYIEFNWINGDLYAKSKEKSVLFQKGNQQYLVDHIHLNLNNQIGEAKNFSIKEENHILIANNIFKKKKHLLMNKITYISDPFFLKKKDNYPDFYLKTDYLKYSFEKKYIFSGPVFFYWYRVPMPIIFPFLYIPIKLNQPSYGIICPKFGIQNKKIYMEDLGLFFPISDFLNFRVDTSIYDIEKWKIKTRIEYKLRYAYDGFINFDYQNISSRKKHYLFQWKHRSDFKSDSDINFNADINYDNIFLHNKNDNFSYINIRKKLSNYLWFMDIYMIQNQKNEIKFIIPELIFHTRKTFFSDKKNFFLNQVNIENKFHLNNFIDFNKKKHFHTDFTHNMSMTAYFPFFDPYLRISSKIFYKDFYRWNSPYFYVSSFQKTDLSINIISIPFYKIWKFKDTFQIKHQIKPILSFHIIYFPPVFYNVKNHFERRIDLILNNNWIIKIPWNTVYKKIEIFKEINSSWIIDPDFIGWKNFYVMGNTDLIQNLEAKYKAGINFDKEKKNNMIYFDFSFSSNHEINFFSIKNEFQKKGKNRYDYFFFDHKNYAKYPIPCNLKIDIHSNYENFLTKKKFFQTFISLNGSINITKYWKIRFHTDYDLLKNKVILANIIFNRDLRSFEMSFNWIFFQNYSWSFFIGLKDPNLRNIIQYNEKN
ncbi:putative LPS assembly protein LptD [Blattabacterium cuenoti]|uniref:putative LPS assembly protein LptD n=1 Tax=Blattabacterium cuenoti TaxID=1653831 RepID=UPI001EEBB2C1|nr:putative LPS assembly protein LptD [Blattabacterium cuenoti]